MERTAFRTLPLFLFLLFFLHLQAGTVYDREEVRLRLQTMECIVKPRYTATVESYIKGYFANGARKAKTILSRSILYFPVFEKYLEAHNMPDDLKYLAVVESGLNPKAVSRVGATGLWQFMKATGAGYGLAINSRVDERSCPNRSTIAAMQYLEKAYRRFGSWELAIASYNCGAGNIRRAIKRAGGSTNYWKISKYLPRETRNFVPAFLAAVYALQFYHLHDVVPQYPHLDLQLTESELVYAGLPFQTIAAVTGLPLSVVQELNPAYKKDFVPASPTGHWVVLPRRTMQALRDYIGLLRPDNGAASQRPTLPPVLEEAGYFPNENYYKTFYTTLNDDHLHTLAGIFSCSKHNLKVWNNLTSEVLTRGQELIVWFPREIKRFGNRHLKTEHLKPLPPKFKKVEPALPATPKIHPIVAIKVTPVPVDKYPHLPFSAKPPATTEKKPAHKRKEKKQTSRKIKNKISLKRLFGKSGSAGFKAG